jgi:hypothetical protein
MSLERRKPPGEAWETVEADSGGGSQTLEQVLTEGNDAGGQDIDMGEAAVVVATGYYRSDGFSLETVLGIIGCGPDSGFFANPPAGNIAFSASGSKGATVAVDAGGLAIINLPTVDPVIAGALWNDGGTPAISVGP